MNKKTIIFLASILVIFAGFYLYNKPKVNPEPLPSEQVTQVIETEKETLGEITFIDNSHLKLKEILKDTNCFVSMDVDMDNDIEVKEKSLQNMQGTITQEEWTKFYVEKVNRKYNNNLPWCPKGVLYIETGNEITFNLNADTIFTTFSFDNPGETVWDKVISKEDVIQAYNTSDGFHGRIEITSRGLNAIKVHLPYQE